MSRLTFSTDDFDCHLQCGRCNHLKNDGTRCKNRVCFGFPICWIHTIQVYGVRLRDSTLPDVGKGLFAARDIPSNSWICPYRGERIGRGCLNQRYGNDTAPYAVTHRRAFIDSACSRGIAAMANGLFRVDGNSMSVRRHNAIIRVRGNGVWLKSRREIRDGDEIFVWYGDNFILQDSHETKRKRGLDSRPC